MVFEWMFLACEADLSFDCSWIWECYRYLRCSKVGLSWLVHSFVGSFAIF